MKTKLFEKLIDRKADVPICKCYMIENGKAKITNLSSFCIINNVDMEDGIYNALGKTKSPMGDFPNFEFGVFKENGIVSGSMIEKIIEYAGYTGNNDLTPNLKCVCLDGENIIACDANILSFEPLKLNVSKELLIPKDNIKRLSILMKEFNPSNVAITSNDSYIKIECHEFTFQTRLEERSYPKYKNVLPDGVQYTKVITIPISSLNAVLKDISNLKKEYKLRIDTAALHITGNKMTYFNLDADFERSYPVTPSYCHGMPKYKSIIVSCVPDNGDDICVCAMMLSKLASKSDFNLYYDSNARALIFDEIK